MARKLDLVLFGASGFTGRLVASYLAGARRREAFSWAIAGRDLTRLEAVRDSLDCGRATAPQCLVADVGDAAAMQAVATKTRVLLSTVGPYQQYGAAVVRACIDGGCDYADITGEPEFVNAMHAQFGAAARERGLRLVHCCGFDAIPADLGVFFTVRALTDGLDDASAADEEIRVEGFVRAQGKFSGGTWQSAVNALGRLGRQRPSAGDDGAGRRWIHAMRPRLRFDYGLRAWACPLPTIDTQIVLQSARDLPGYGVSFEYGHHACVRHLGAVAGGALAIGGLVALSQIPAGREWLRARNPSGTGPSTAQRRRGRFSLQLRGQSTRRKVEAEVRGGDPGYDETAKMLGESGLCLALDHAELGPERGILTPAVAMGEHLLRRLEAAGIEFRLLRSDDRR